MNRIVSVKLYKNRYNTYISIVWIACFAIFSSILREIGISDKIPEIMVVLWITAGTIFLYYFSIEILLSKNDKILFWISYFFRITYAIYKYGISDLSEPSLNADAAGFWNVANQYYIGDYHTVYTVFPYILNLKYSE